MDSYPHSKAMLYVAVSLYNFIVSSATNILHQVFVKMGLATQIGMKGWLSEVRIMFAEMLISADILLRVAY